jgi:hypothetical protein
MADAVPSIFASFCQFLPLLASAIKAPQSWTEPAEPELVEVEIPKASVRIIQVI